MARLTRLRTVVGPRVRRVQSVLNPLPRLDAWAPETVLRVAQTSVTEPCHPVVDAHNHLGRWLTRGRWVVPDVAELVDVMDRLKIRTVVNLDGVTPPELDANLRRYDERHPGRFATFTHLNYRALLRGNHSDGLGQLDAAVRRGARGIKVWKDLGLSVRDGRGRRVKLSDPRLRPAWEMAAEHGLPVILHFGDPRAFFLPADRRNERVEELLTHRVLQRHRRRGPSFEQLLDEFEEMLDSAPATTVVAAHLANCGDDLATCARLLEEHPGLCMDTSARLSELGRQPRAAKAFLTRYQSRILFGTDAYPPTAEELIVWFRALETEDEYFSYTAGRMIEGRWMIYGLGLDPEVLANIYSRNATRVLGLDSLS